MAIASLAYREFNPHRGRCRAIVIAIHGEGEDLKQLATFCTNLDLPMKVLCPQAPRAVNPRSVNANNEGGYSWFFAHDIGRPEPATFGDCLWQFEQFIFDVLEHHGRATPIFVVGIDQGALLALTLGSMIPQYLGGAVAINGILPEMRNCSVFSHDMLRMPVLIVRDPLGPPELRERINRSASDLTFRNASVVIEEIKGLSQDISTASLPLSTWLRSLSYPTETH
jgi:predicted esterase